jgi:UPF0755 protein
MAKKKTSFFRKIIISLVVMGVLLIGAGGYYVYKNIFQPNVNLGEKKSQVIYIPTGSGFEDVVRILQENNILKNRASFEWLSEKKKYKNAIKPGKYRILASMNNNSLINLLRAGIQEPVDINFNGLHSLDEFLSRVCRRIEADSATLFDDAHNTEYVNKLGFTKDNFQAMFIPDTYQFFWNTSVDEFYNRMAKEYKTFWTDERKKKAKATGYSQTDITILASIVQGEQCCDNEEKKIIAGLYINRLKKDMKMESDPTVIFALGDFTKQRVTNEDKKVDSPYNTYINKSLPPGPVSFPQASTIDAVLNYTKSDYIFMCAKEDLKGKHYFAKTYDEHKIYAKRYHDALNSRGIH